jgi:hypothetical protein
LENRRIKMEETWDVEVTYKVTGKEVYTDTQRWEKIKPKKVGLMMKILKEAQEKFIKEASSV